MPGRRSRLSNGEALLAAREEFLKGECEDTGNAPTSTSGGGANRNRGHRRSGGRRSIGGRRSGGRRSFGGGDAGDAPLLPSKETAAAMKEMYAKINDIIQLSSENKITTKNAWNMGVTVDSIMDSALDADSADTSSTTHNSKKSRTGDNSESTSNTGSSQQRQKVVAPTGVNFQKASCKLDASVKIYSVRVDDTHASSYRILENLTRNKAAVEKDIDQGGDDAAGPAVVGSKALSNKFCMASTLEKNVSKLNVDPKAAERTFNVDPTFHKMSKLFDEGGASGLLLANLPLHPALGCRIAFGMAEDEDGAVASDDDESAHKDGKLPGEGKIEQEKTGSEEEARTASPMAAGGMSPEEHAAHQEHAAKAKEVRAAQRAAEAAEMAAASESSIDCVASLRARVERRVGEVSSSSSSMIQDVALVPQLAEFRQEIAEGGCVARDSSESSMNENEEQSEDIDEYDADFDMDDDDNAGEGYHMNLDDFDDGHSSLSFRGDNEADCSVVANERPPAGTFLMGGGKRASLAVVTDRMGGSEVLESVLSSTNEAMIFDNEYSFFDMKRLAAMNLWAGAAHWKFGRRHPTTNKSTTTLDGSVLTSEGAGSTDGNDDASGQKTTTKKKKKAQGIVFGGDIDAEALAEALKPPLAPSKGTGSSSKKGNGVEDANQLSAAAITKCKKAAEELAYGLPEDVRMDVATLGRLFLRPSAMVRRRRGQHGKTQDVFAKDDGHFAFGAGDDQFADGPIDDSFGDDGNDGFYMNEDADQYGSSSSSPSSSVAEDVDASKMLKADRHVEKLRVKHATRAKRVDVRELKHQIWEDISTLVSSDATATAETGVDSDGEDEEKKTSEEENHQDAMPSSVQKKKSAGSGAGDENKSFAQVMNKCAAGQQQSGVTLPFYFICVLHLANEHGLKLEGNENLSDFTIAMDAC